MQIRPKRTVESNTFCPYRTSTSLFPSVPFLLFACSHPSFLSFFLSPSEHLLVVFSLSFILHLASHSPNIHNIAMTTIDAHLPTMHTSETSLTVLIVRIGLTGLFLGTCLENDKISHQIFERASKLKSSGMFACTVTQT